MSRRLRKAKSGVLKRSMMAASVTAMLGAGVIGAGFVSPVMADALKKIHRFGIIYNGTSDEAVEAARDQGIVFEPEQSVTHNGITLKLASLLYDGTRLSYVLERARFPCNGYNAINALPGSHYLAMHRILDLFFMSPDYEGTYRN